MTSPHKKNRKPHKFEVNSTKSRSLTHFDFFLEKKWSKSKNKILFKSVFLARISKIKLNFEFSDRFKSKRLGKAKIFFQEEHLY